MKIRVGILMGGASREREISFAGGRTVYDVLDKALFDPVPLFADAAGNIAVLNWKYLYKGTIRDFFPPKAALPPTSPFQPYAEQLGNDDDAAARALLAEVGRPIALEELKHLVDVVFLTLHGRLGEDGTIQGLLEWLGIPYTGSGLFGSTFGLDKSVQRSLLAAKGFASPRAILVPTQVALSDRAATRERIRTEVGFPCVVKHPTQGSSIGVQIVKTEDGLEAALQAVSFTQVVDANEFMGQPLETQVQQVQHWTDLRDGLGLPLYVESASVADPCLVSSPDALLRLLQQQGNEVVLRAVDAPKSILIEEFIDGAEFSVIVIEDSDGHSLALPPTEIRKGQAALFDYRSKYLPGLVRKVTPIELPDAQVEAICREAERLKETFRFDVYARLDGIYSPDGRVYFNDPNTTSGMLPGSFFFHQAAEVGFTPSAFLTYIIHRSLVHRAVLGVNPLPSAHRLATKLEATLAHLGQTASARTQVGVLLGGYSSERHISVESGRNVFEKLNSSGEFEASPIFLLDNSQVPEPLRVQLAIPHHEPFSFWEIPISYLLKDNADDIADKIVKAAQGLPVPQTLRRIWQSAAPLRSRYVASPLTQPARLTLNELANRFQFVFLGLHGRPGEDGQVQALLQQAGIAYNGSTPASAALTIDKYATNQLLRQHGIAVANHRLVHKTEWMQNPAGVTAELEQGLGFPLIAKPQDDGCSSAVQRIDTPKELAAYCKAIFREQGSGVDPQTQSVLGLKPNEEFPAKATALFENLISPPAGWRQIEVTVGFVTHTDPEGNVQVEVLEPSEALAAGKVLTLEEKFLAGEGQNITPARLSPDPALQAALTHKLKTAIATTARTVGAHGYGRIDAFVQISPAGECRVVIIEVNSLPGMTPATCIFHQAAENGYTPHQFIATIITEGKRKSFIMP